jgi:hypothetical protein
VSHADSDEDSSLKHHDYKLQGYEIADFGGTVTLNLVYGYVGMPREKSHIRFSQLALYLGFYGIVIAGSVKQIPN